MCYVEDLVVFGEMNVLLEQFKTELSMKLKGKDLGYPKQLLKAESDCCSPTTVQIKQTNLISNLLKIP